MKTGRSKTVGLFLNENVNKGKVRLQLDTTLFWSGKGW